MSLKDDQATYIIRTAAIFLTVFSNHFHLVNTTCYNDLCGDSGVFISAVIEYAWKQLKTIH